MKLDRLAKLNATLWGLGLLWASTQAKSVSQTLPLSANLTSLTSVAGEKLLQNSQAQQDFIPLSSQFITQENQAFCGVASMVMVLNALSIPAPLATQWQRNYFTQDNIFNPQTEAIIPRQQIERQGLTLAQVAAILQSYSVKAEVLYGGDLSLDVFRNRVRQNLNQRFNFVLVNYSRQTLGQEGGGHISPLAAYNAKTDQFLILDVSRYKYPSVWVSAKELWEATRTLDSVAQKTRGVVLISLP